MDALDSLINISQAVAKNHFEIQGGGGNTSVKIDDESMIIKASGYELSQVRNNSGYVTVNFNNIRDFLTNASPNTSDVDYVKLLDHESKDKLRPSMETGFHAILDRVVLHTHSAYANILCCSKEGEKLAYEIFSDQAILWVPYANPGLELSLSINKKILEYLKSKKHLPKIIFLENHGSIVSASTDQECIYLNQNLNKKIQTWFKDLPDFPEYQELHSQEQYFHSSSEYVINYLNQSFHDIFKNVLFPDQVVYLRRENIKLIDNKFLYYTNQKEAKTIEETLLSHIYLVQCFNQLKFSPKYLDPIIVEYLNNVETEKYRRSILKKQ